jgi:hypothetical protein
LGEACLRTRAPLTGGGLRCATWRLRLLCFPLGIREGRR